MTSKEFRISKGQLRNQTIVNCYVPNVNTYVPIIVNFYWSSSFVLLEVWVPYLSFGHWKIFICIFPIHIPIDDVNNKSWTIITFTFKKIASPLGTLAYISPPTCSTPATWNENNYMPKKIWITPSIPKYI